MVAKWVGGFTKIGELKQAARLECIMEVVHSVEMEKVFKAKIQE